MKIVEFSNVLSHKFTIFLISNSRLQLMDESKLLLVDLFTALQMEDIDHNRLFQMTGQRAPISFNLNQLHLHQMGIFMLQKVILKELIASEWLQQMERFPLWLGGSHHATVWMLHVHVSK